MLKENWNLEYSRFCNSAWKNENLEYSRLWILLSKNLNLEYSRYQKWSEHNVLDSPCMICIVLYSLRQCQHLPYHLPWYGHILILYIPLRMFMTPFLISSRHLPDTSHTRLPDTVRTQTRHTKQTKIKGLRNSYSNIKSCLLFWWCRMSIKKTNTYCSK